MIDWHERFQDQLNWNFNLREYLYKKINIADKKRLLEIGCGTGALLQEISSKTCAELYGVDIDEERLKFAKKNLNEQKIKAVLYLEDFLNNKFQDNSFDIIITNCVFLWLDELNRIFDEIYRILQPGGTLLIFAEPDYDGLIEYPDTGLKSALINNIRSEGANTQTGRQLNQFFADRFFVKEHFCNSIPWISNKNQDGLLKEVEFFREKLKLEDFDSNKMRICIEMNNYFIFVPVFSYYLEKL